MKVKIMYHCSNDSCLKDGQYNIETEPQVTDSLRKQNALQHLHKQLVKTLKDINISMFTDDVITQTRPKNDSKQEQLLDKKINTALALMRTRAQNTEIITYIQP